MEHFPNFILVYLKIRIDFNHIETNQVSSGCCPLQDKVGLSLGQSAPTLGTSSLDKGWITSIDIPGNVDRVGIFLVTFEILKGLIHGFADATEHFDVIRSKDLDLVLLEQFFLSFIQVSESNKDDILRLERWGKPVKRLHVSFLDPS